MGVSTKAKVTWNTIILPKSAGGLGISDPILQSKPMLAKLVIRSLLLGNEVWKHLLINRMVKQSSVIGKPWKEEIRRIFTKEVKLKKTHKWEERFINGIWSAWKFIRRGVIRRPRKCGAEISRQPLTWNKLFIGLAWGQMADGPGQSFGSWQDFVAFSWEAQNTMLASLCDGRTMATEINNSIANYLLSSTISNTYTGWFELSLDEGLDRYVIEVNAEGTHCWFFVEDNGSYLKLQHQYRIPLTRNYGGKSEL